MNVYMLIGVNKNTGDRVMASKDNADIISDLAKDKLLICPECNSLLTFKNGEVKIPHFAHKTKCTYLYWEPESEEHIQGKLAVKYRLERLYPNSKVYIEYSVKETNQRSDVMVVHPNNEKWAFEIQLSKIPLSTLIERHELYKAAGIQDFWLLGAKAFEVINLSTAEKAERNVVELGNVCWLMHFASQDNVENKEDLIRIVGVEKPYSLIFHKGRSGTIKLKRLVVTKDKDHYEFKNQINFKKAYEHYISSKQVIKIHFEKQYPKSKIYSDYIIEGTNEKADILIENTSTGGKCAINIIVGHLHYRKSEERMRVYEDHNIIVFWLYGLMKQSNGSGILHDSVIPNHYKYYLSQIKTSKWIIHHYIESLSTGVIALDNVIFKFNERYQAYFLEDKHEINKRQPELRYIEKEINWAKGQGGWAGFVYSCPKIGRDTTVFNAQMITKCDTCKGFHGFRKEGSKKTHVYCSIL